MVYSKYLNKESINTTILIKTKKKFKKLFNFFLKFKLIGERETRETFENLLERGCRL